jgi:type VI secretion system secreted protein VgrG
MKGDEHLCSDYQFNLTVLCYKLVDSIQLIGLNAQLSWDIDEKRSIHHGIISQINAEGIFNEKYQYTLIMRSPLYSLRLSCHHQTYQDQDIVHIISDVLQVNGWPCHAYRFTIVKQVQNIDFIAHINHNDFQFIHKLLMRYGLVYYFEQLQDFALLVITDNTTGLLSISETDLYYQPQTTLNSNSFSIYHLQNSNTLLADYFKLDEYNYMNQDVDLEITSRNTTTILGAGCISLNDQNYLSQADGQLIINALQNQLDCKRIIFIAKSNYRDLTIGQIVTINGHPQNTWNTKYQIISLSHEITQDYLTSSIDTQKDITYLNTIKLISLPSFSATFKYQHQISFIFAKIQGIILGKIISINFNQSNAAIDEYGRYVVLLPYTMDTKLVTIPLRLLQYYGGNHHNNKIYGWHFPLKIGTVVMLTFNNGDINRPIILGVVPNKLMMSPINANNHTQNKITTAGSHQLLFEELIGSQKIIWQTPDQSNFLILNTTQNDHKIELLSQVGQLQFFAHNNLHLFTESSINSHCNDDHRTLIHNQQKLNSQQSIVFQSGNDIKLNANDNINIISQNGHINMLTHYDFIAQINKKFTLQAEMNWQSTLENGNIYCMSYHNITLACTQSGNIFLKQDHNIINLNNSENVLIQANSIYLNAPKICLGKNVLVNGQPL